MRVVKWALPSLLKRTGDRVLGTPQERAIHAAAKRALVAAGRRLEDEYARTAEQVAHLDLLFGDLLLAAAVRGAFQGEDARRRGSRAAEFLAEVRIERTDLDVPTAEQPDVVATFVSTFAECFSGELHALGELATRAVDDGALRRRDVADRRSTDLDPLSDATRAAVLEGVGLVATLKNLYPNYRLVQIDGQEAPITVLPAKEEDWTDIEAALAPPLHLFESSADPGSYRAWLFDPRAEPDYYGHLAEQSRSTKWNDPAYRALEIRDPRGRPRIVCGMGWYFESLATSEVLDAELMRALAPAPGRAVPLAALPRRSWIHDRAVDPVTDGSGRSAALSVATVTMYRVDDRYEVVLSPRASWVARHRLYNHVAPSGIFQPFNRSSASSQSEFSVRTTLLRELLEELYGREDYDRKGSRLLQDPASEPEVRNLTTMLEDGRAELLYTGISINLLTLRPEICTLLLIHDPLWIQDPALVLGSEYLPGSHEHDLGAGRQHLTSVALDHALRPVGTGNELKNRALIPNAAAALQLATPVAAERIASVA
jgi:hypothetical protein